MIHARGVCVLITVLTLWCFTAATELRCFVGEEICSQWKNVENAEYGNFNGKVVCCPPEQNQAIILLGGLSEPENCKCKAGTAEKYANVGKSGSSGTVFGPWPLAVLVMASAGAHLV